MVKRRGKGKEVFVSKETSEEAGNRIEEPIKESFYNIHKIP
jgi:hypothetical protein